MALGDVNGDAHVDIVFADARANSLYINQGGRTFAPGALLDQTHASSVDVVIVDLLGDALPELVFANPAADAAVYQTWPSSERCKCR